MSKHETIKELREHRHTGSYRLVGELIAAEERACLDRLRGAETEKDMHRLQGALGALESLRNAMQIPL